MGGSVEVESAPGRGTTFRFSFLAEETASGSDRESSNREDDAVILSGRRVLIADDVETNRMVMRLFLRAQGVETVEVADGEEALRALAEGGFDAALVDLNMPGLSGTEIARRIRLSETGNPDLPLVAVTADSASRDVDLGPKGFDTVLCKPIDPRALQSALRQALRRARSHGAAGSGGPSSP